MTTEAGRRLLDDLLVDLPYERDNLDRAIATIEAEARAALLAELEVEVLKIPTAGRHPTEVKRAVLDLIRKAGA